MFRFLPLLFANLRRRTPRSIFTLLSIAVAFLLFGLLAAVKNGFEASGNLAGVDRLITMAKVSIVQPLPISYLQRIARLTQDNLIHKLRMALCDRRRSQTRVTRGIAAQ